MKKDEKVVGEVTSGIFGPTVKRGAGMAYVKPQYAEEGTEIEILIREKGYTAKISNFPLFDETKYGWKRKTS
ncbi:MAG: glycine cleavage T C-terminal barrel domain-containing protein [Candidatus Wukongarchaeota archaeon]|nr:glycine cleavage T C-terminal barrel domain-containing protein [Candidatus Wukongarchaeota archaeon]